jgi:hypothetical protein
MSSTIHPNMAHVSQKAETATRVKINSKESFWQMTEAHRFAITPMLLVVVACLGGFAAAYVLQEEVYKLAVIAISIGLVEAFILAVMPMRTIIIASMVSLALSLLMVML